MNVVRMNSSPQLLPLGGLDRQNESALEGNVKLLSRLIQDYTDASRKDVGCKLPQCVTGMITVIDDMKSQVQELQSPRKKEAELRRCNSDLWRVAPPREKKTHDPTTGDTQTLRRELFASMNARKSLEKMFCSLGKEKEIIAAELARKVRELRETEELVEDLRAQNERLLEKVKACASKKNDGASVGGESSQFNSVLQERNKTLSEQLLKSLDGYRSMRRRLQDAEEEKARVVSEVAKAAAAGTGIVRGLREKMERGCDGKVGISEQEIKFLEQMLAGLQGKLVKVSSKKADC